MSNRATLESIANLMIRQALNEVNAGAGLNEALEMAYPFGNSPQGRTIWAEAIVQMRAQWDQTNLAEPDADFN